MKAMVFLLRKRLVNTIKQLRKSPGKIVFILLLAFLLIISIIGNGHQAVPEEGVQYRDKSELYSIVFAYFTLMTMFLTYNGFQKGASFFSMADVNLLFNAPISSKRILFYGLIQQMITGVYAGVFLLFQGTWMKNVYNVDFDFVLITIGVYVLVMMLSQMMAMMIYTITEHRENRIKIAKAVYFIFILVLVGTVAYFMYQDGKFSYMALVEAAESPVAVFFPITGFAKMLIVSIYEANVLKAIIWLCGLILTALVMLIIILKKHNDYYEDVLQATEVSFSAITAQKEGRAKEALPQNIKVGNTGITRGWGASTIYKKHLIENRRAGVMLFSMTDIIFMVINIVFAIVVRNIMVIAGFTIYLQMMTSATGRMPKELLLPYIYMIPESPFKKLMFSIYEAFHRVLLQAIVIFGIIGVIIKLDIVDIIALVILRVTAEYLFLAANILTERLFGSFNDRKGLSVMLYFISCMACLIPGAVVGITLGMVLESYALGFICAAIINVPMATLTIYLCRNILVYAEYNNH